jgi:GT2 family glycosyltransferase
VDSPQIVHYKQNSTHPDHRSIFDRGITPFAEMSTPENPFSQPGENPLDANPAPELSIVIPVFNQVAYTKQCVESLLKDASSSPVPYEVIVVDNASTDETSAYLESVNSRVRSKRNPANLGFGPACNVGAKLAQGRFLVFLNNDTVPLNHWIEPCIQRLKSDEDIGIVGNKLIYPDGTIQHGGIEFVSRKAPPLSHWPVHRFRGLPAHHPAALESAEVGAITGACLFIKRELFWSVGGFTEDYVMYFEDVDLNLKIRKLGKKIVYEPRSHVVHFESKSTSQREGNELFLKAAQIFYTRWAPELKELLGEVKPMEGNYA